MEQDARRKADEKEKGKYLGCNSSPSFFKSSETLGDACKSIVRRYFFMNKRWSIYRKQLK